MNKKRILIVDDERALADALKVKLTRAGFEVTTLYSGTEALNLLQEEQYDLILLDILMPNTDGWTIMKAMQGKAKIVVTSNLSQAEDIAKAKSFGAIEFLVKSEESLSDIESKVMILLED